MKKVRRVYILRSGLWGSWLLLLSWLRLRLRRWLRLLRMLLLVIQRLRIGVEIRKHRLGIGDGLSILI